MKKVFEHVKNWLLEPRELSTCDFIAFNILGILFVIEILCVLIVYFGNMQ